MHVNELVPMLFVKDVVLKQGQNLFGIYETLKCLS